ncbi:class I SAM-dependent methyltransferase [Candidatus Dependentiae bacterium]
MSKKQFLIYSLLFLFSFSACVYICSDLSVFMSAIFRNQQRVGAILPSSVFLARSITKNIVAKDQPIKVLEIGAGTGVFTEQVLEKLRKEDIFDVIEIDVSLCEVLREKCKDYKNVHVHCISVLDWDPPYKYDFIISGLPFNSFGSDFVFSVLDRYTKIIKKNGILSYFEYLWAYPIKKFFLKGTDKIDYMKSKCLLSDFRRKFEFDRDFIFPNIPPAYTYHLRIEKE